MSNQASWWQRLWTPFLASAPGRTLIRYGLQPLDRILLPLTGGRATISKLVFPTLLLTTTGARSGQPRETPLLYFRDGARVVLIASNYGGERHPAWYHNLRANPLATLTLEGRTALYRAHEAAGAERDELWRKAVALYGGYAEYQRRAGQRQIPVLVLMPESA